MYKKLLISAGGGIISRGQQAQQNEAATIAIGLGGTGISCLRALKKEVYDRLEPDDDKALVPNYKHIKFLAIDTDESSLGDNGSIDTLDKNTEFLDFSCNDINAMLQNGTVLKNNPSLKWLKASSTEPMGSDSISILSAEAGAGGVRQVGRLLLLQNCNSFVSKLTSLITEAKRDLPNGAEINVHIFTGIGGGTGAGTFLDVCYLVQHVLNSMGIYGAAQTCGYFFLPDVNIDKVENDLVRQYIKSNGFAAMKELDYCMNFELNGGEWKQTYDGFEITSKEPPVKLAHLVTATNAGGALVTDAYNYAMHVVVDYVMDFLIKPNVTDQPNSEVFTIKSHIANIQRIRGVARKDHGAGYDYCILGASNTYIPYKEITTYLTSKIFEGFSRIDQQLPGDNDIDLFIQTTGLKYEDLCKELRAKVPSVPLYEVDKKTIYEQTAGLSSDVIPQVLGQMRDSLSRIGGQVAENKKNMLQALEVINEDSQKGISSLISRVRRKIVEISQQPDKGPYYGGAILHSVKARDLQNRIDGYIEQNSRNLSNARADMTLRDQSVAQTLREIQNSNGMNRKSRGNAYVQAVQSYFRQQAEIEFYTTLGDILVTFKQQISDLYTQEFAIFETVMRNLEATFAANLTTLANPVTESKDYAVKLMTIQDLKGSLDTSVKEMRIDDLISGFVNYMLNDKDMWIAQDENKITRVVSDFFLGELKQYTARTMDDYLEIKYDSKDKEFLKKQIYDDVMMKLADKAKPLFWTDTSKFRMQPNTELGFLTIPNVSDMIQGAASDFNVANKNITIRPSYCTDRISFLIFDCAIPMYAYKGVDNYKDVPPATGAHLYEKSVADSRDWRKLWNITPLSCIDENNMSENVAKLKEMLDLAEEKHIFRKSTESDVTEYSIVEYSEEALNELINKVDNLIAEGNETKCEALLSNVETNELPIASKRAVKNMGAGNRELEDLMVKDIILESCVLVSMISKQLDLITKKDIAIKKLKDFIDSKSAVKTNVKYFAGALCTGVIAKENEYTYTYKKITFGVSEDVALTTIDSKPYGEDIPLYSAYIGFTQLDEETIAEIAQTIRDKKVNCPDEVSMATANAKELISEDKTNKIVQRVRQSYASELNDILTFLKSFSFEVTNF